MELFQPSKDFKYDCQEHQYLSKTDPCPLCAETEFSDNLKPDILPLNTEEVYALYMYFLNDAGYLSHEHHPKVHKLIDRMKEFLR